MKKLNTSMLFFFIISAFVSNSYAQPKFTIIGGDEYNWGDVKPKDSPLKAAIQFKNEGNENLVIKSVRPSCGCTAAKPAKDTLAPGETTTMDVAFNVGTGTGVNSKSITVETNDPKKAKTIYKISANVIREIICKPSGHLPFKDLKVGAESSSTVYIKNNSKADITFSDLKVEPPTLKLTIPANFTLKPNQEMEITGRWTPTKAGYMNSKISFKTNNPDYPVFEIPAYGNAAESPIFNNGSK